MESNELSSEQTQAIEAMGQQLDLPPEYDIEEVAIAVKPNSTVIVQIVLDKDGGIDIDTLGKLHSDSVDSLHEKLEEILGDKCEYEIEFTSRGVNAPLSLVRHWRRNIGRKVRLKLRDNSQIIARIARIDESVKSVTLVFNDKGILLQKEYPLEDIKSAKIEIEFNSPPSAELALCDSLEHTSG